ncbi:hypothetical protein [Nisaea sp.]|uniref:hypothetical protein n=1 Tax=Nisaea sp. TaxID=2024842 RepID=UPI003B525709
MNEPIEQITSSLDPTAIILTPWTIMTATAGLVAFHIGLYTLIGRERKSPYVINSAFPIFIFSLIVVILSIASIFFDKPYQKYILQCSTIVLLIALILSIITVFRITIRFKYFVDTINPKHLPIFRFARRYKYNKNRAPTYEHNPKSISGSIKSSIIDYFQKRDNANFCVFDRDFCDSLSIKTNNKNQSDDILIDLSLIFLKSNNLVQYLTASRHPIEFIGKLENAVKDRESEWTDFQNRIVAIDAYSPHFAFTDSIYEKKSQAIEELGVTLIESSMTYAGMHSASSKAFNALKKKSQSDTRTPTLVIYEGTQALADLESAEQYRIFVRHVIPSERMWGGMFTVFLESPCDDANWKLLQSYASMSVDLTGLEPSSE